MNNYIINSPWDDWKQNEMNAYLYIIIEISLYCTHRICLNLCVTFGEKKKIFWIESQRYVLSYSTAGRAAHSESLYARFFNIRLHLIRCNTYTIVLFARGGRTERRDKRVFTFKMEFFFFYVIFSTHRQRWAGTPNSFWVRYSLGIHRFRRLSVEQI